LLDELGEGGEGAVQVQVQVVVYVYGIDIDIVGGISCGNAGGLLCRGRNRCGDYFAKGWSLKHGFGQGSLGYDCNKDWNGIVVWLSFLDHWYDTIFMIVPSCNK